MGLRWALSVLQHSPAGHDTTGALDAIALECVPGDTGRAIRLSLSTLAILIRCRRSRRLPEPDTELPLALPAGLPTAVPEGVVYRLNGRRRLGQVDDCRLVAVRTKNLLYHPVCTVVRRANRCGCRSLPAPVDLGAAGVPRCRAEERESRRGPTGRLRRPTRTTPGRRESAPVGQGTELVHRQY